MRPELTSSLAAETFLDHYWLREELIVFCRSESLPTTGSKQVLTDRIAHFLSTGEVLVTPKVSKKSGVMPSSFEPETRIGAGWRCNQELDSFLKYIWEQVSGLTGS